MKNHSYVDTYQVSVILRVETVTYTGKVGDPVKRSDSERFVRPGVMDEVKLEVSWSEYGPRLLDQSAFNISCLATVKDTNFEYFAQDDFRVRKPDIIVEVIATRKIMLVIISQVAFNIASIFLFCFQLANDPIVGELLEATARFTNPIPIALKRGKFLIEGPGLKEQLKLKLTEDVEVGGEAACRFTMTPVFEGRATIAAKFYSKELDDVDGFINFMVKLPAYRNE